jgi:hypothetical protein
MPAGIDDALQESHQYQVRSGLAKDDPLHARLAQARDQRVDVGQALEDHRLLAGPVGGLERPSRS